jgi:hypothetical protein
MEDKMMHINALLMVNVVFGFLNVVIGAYSDQHHRHRTFTRFLYHGANSLFAPIMSYTMSTFSNIDVTGLMSDKATFVAFCDAVSQTILVLHIASLVQVIAINTSTFWLLAMVEKATTFVVHSYCFYKLYGFPTLHAIYISDYSPFTRGFNLDMAINEIKNELDLYYLHHLLLYM